MDDPKKLSGCRKFTRLFLVNLAVLYLISILNILILLCVTDQSLKPTASIETVSVDPCTALPCEMHLGRNATISIKFTPTDMAQKLTSKVHANIGAWLPFPLPDPDACKNSGLTCPLKPGIESMYHYTMNVKAPISDLNVFLRWEVVDESSKDVICVEFEVKIVK